MELPEEKLTEKLYFLTGFIIWCGILDNMKTVLIIGSAGFVGSHLTEGCLSNGWKVIGIDDFSSGKQENLKNINNRNFIFIKQDLSKPNSVSSLKKII